MSVTGRNPKVYYETRAECCEKTDWRIMRGNGYLTLSDYTMVMEASSKYNCSTSSGAEYTYKLYRCDPEAAQNGTDTEAEPVEDEETEDDVTNDIIY